jgi:ADP-ribose pyrophosphatase
MPPPEVVADDDFGPRGFRWLTLRRLTWRGADGRTRHWELASRRGRAAAAGVDAVAVVARVAPHDGHPARCVVISQFRPPLGRACLELPAGLVDAGEAAGAAALRELAEETGYVCEALAALSPVCAADPGLTDANLRLAVAEIDLGAAGNAEAAQALEDGEEIEVLLAPWDSLYEWLLERMARENCEVDSRLLAFALGLKLSSGGGGEGGAAAAAAP